ncbi:MAG: hypothetical protein H8E97_00505 [Bacteroidetes bacterium]|nr:hypothetical protein [Bacteroidota bacterium]
MKLSQILNAVYESSTEKEKTHGGFGNGDGTFSNVPYQMIRTLYHSPTERNELKRASYVYMSAPGAEKNPYSDNFAKMFDTYIEEVNKALHRIAGDLRIEVFHSLSGGCFYFLK